VTAPDVLVPRKALRGMRSLVAGVVVCLIAGTGLVALDGHRRCEAGNRFRREDLPAAFALHDRHLGEALGATEEQIVEFEAEFQAELDELFPERDCSLM
jgi:hypothetical protein